MRTTRWSAALCAVSLSACGLTNYQKATAQFSSSATAGVAAARDAMTAARDTCEMRAWFHIVSDRFERPDFKTGTEPLAQSSGVAKKSGGTLTWGELCGQLGEYDQAMSAVLSALDAYAGALKSLATDDKIALDTGLTSAFATDASAVATQLGSSALTQVQAASGPIAALADAVLALVKSGELRAAVKKSEQPVAQVLAAVQAYLKASQDQLDDAKRLYLALLKEADAKIPIRDGAVSPMLPGQALALYEFSRQEGARIDAASAKLAATGKLIDAIGASNTELAKASNAAITDEQLLVFLGTQAAAIVKQINLLTQIK
jgi:hypothetical protein